MTVLQSDFFASGGFLKRVNSPIMLGVLVVEGYLLGE